MVSICPLQVHGSSVSKLSWNCWALWKGFSAALTFPEALVLSTEGGRALSYNEKGKQEECGTYKLLFLEFLGLWLWLSVHFPFDGRLRSKSIAFYSLSATIHKDV